MLTKFGYEVRTISNVLESGHVHMEHMGLCDICQYFVHISFIIDKYPSFRFDQLAGLRLC